MNTPAPSGAEQIGVSQAGPMYVTVFLIPIVGGNGNIQNRSLVFRRPPTKEHALRVVTNIHESSRERGDYANEWQRCFDTLQQVPEELFSKMNQRRARSFTYMVTITLPDGSTQTRILSARSSFVHDTDGFQ